MLPSASCACSVNEYVPGESASPNTATAPAGRPTPATGFSTNPGGSGVNAVTVYGAVPPTGTTLDEDTEPRSAVPRFEPVANPIVFAVGADTLSVTNAVKVLPSES